MKTTKGTDPRRASTEMEARALKEGARVVQDLPAGYRRGRFVLAGTITDNATTAADLTASAAQVDREMWEVAGNTAATATPKIVGRLERLGLWIVEGTETVPLLGTLLTNLVLKHTPVGGRTRYISLHKFITSCVAVPTRAATDGLAVTMKKPRLRTIENGPIVVNFEKDEFAVFPHTAVNMAADVPFKLFFDGWIYSNAGYQPGDGIPDAAIDARLPELQAEKNRIDNLFADFN